jgi:hypothetical protein
LRGVITISLICLLGLFGEVRSQVPPHLDSLPYLADVYNERFILQTDRNIYAVGERILFRVFNTSRPEIQKENWSKVLYIELIKPDGTSVKQAKYPLTQYGVYGYLEIPGELLTGNYYIVLYTKWMRNFSPADYTYNMIRIINPYKSKLEESCNAIETFTDSVKIKNATDSGTGTRQVLKKNIIICKADKKIYQQRDKVIVKIDVPVEIISSLTGCCISVVRPGVTDTMGYPGLLPDFIDFPQTQYLNYVPEKKGMTVSGKIVSKTNQEPITAASVQLSVLSDSPGFSEYNTGGNGEFLFVLDPLAGNHDLFISATHQSAQSIEILIDNDFSADRVKFNNKPFILTEQERERAKEIMFNMQVSKFYNNGIFKNIQPELTDVRPFNFYGKPSNVVYLDDYIELPTLEEVFIELVPEVYPVIRKKKTQLIMKNEYYSNQSLSFDPLILIDHLPINDLDKVLLLPPSRIQRIEVVNELFLQGKFFYGGIISIFTKENDLGGIELPENSFFFNFKNFEDQESIKFPEYHVNDSTDGNLPDYRNCLYWDPDLHINPSPSTQVNFYTSDSRGEYIIYVRGVTKTGDLIEGNCGFRVE